MKELGTVFWDMQTESIQKRRKEKKTGSILLTEAVLTKEYSE